MTDHIYSLLRAAMWQRPADAKRIGNLSPCDWRKVYEEARRQAVSSLVLSAVSHLDDASLPPESLLIRWIADDEAIRQRGRQMDKAIGSMSGLLRKSGISTVLLKGQAIAAMYPDPATRQCGDIDLWPLRCDNPDLIPHALGIDDIHHHADGSVSFSFRGSVVEVHPRMLDIHSRRSQRRLREIPSVTRPVRAILADGTEVLTPSPEATLLMLSAHIFKHAIGNGIGMRQLCDMAVASERLKKHVPAAGMRRIIKACRFEKWTHTLYSFLTLRLGLPLDAVPAGGSFHPSERLAARLEKIILEGGNFGRYSDRRHQPDGPTGTALSFMRRSGFALSTAPAEAAACCMTLLSGRMHNISHE